MTKQRGIRIMVGLIAGLLLTTMMFNGSTASAQVTQVNGKVTLKQADGTVTVDGRPAAKGDEIASGATVQTAKGSSAVVSLGKLGRVEVHSETTLKLSYTDTGVTAMLSQGRVRVSSSSGVVTTNDGQIITLGNTRSDFLVDVTCGNTFVAVRVGRVELRAGNSVKQIAAGGQDTAGVQRPGCTRDE